MHAHTIITSVTLPRTSDGNVDWRQACRDLLDVPELSSHAVLGMTNRFAQFYALGAGTETDDEAAIAAAFMGLSPDIIGSPEKAYQTAVDYVTAQLTGAYHAKAETPEDPGAALAVRMAEAIGNKWNATTEYVGRGGQA